MSPTINISNSAVFIISTGEPGDTSAGVPDITSTSAPDNPTTLLQREMPPPFVPTSMSAVETNKLSVLFYARPDGQLASLTAQKSGEDPNNPDYKAANVLFEQNTVTAAVAQVSAIAYDFHGQKEVFHSIIVAQLETPT